MRSFEVKFGGIWWVRLTLEAVDEEGTRVEGF